MSTAAQRGSCSYWGAVKGFWEAIVGEGLMGEEGMGGEERRDGGREVGAAVEGGYRGIYGICEASE